MEQKDNRTEKPTARRLQKAREKGQVARSREVSGAAVMLGSLLLLSYFGQHLLGALQACMREFLRLSVPRDITPTYISSLLGSLAVTLGTAVLPLLLAAFAMAFAANAAQSGITISWQALSFQFEKLSPKAGLSRFLSKNGLFELAKSLCLLAVVSVIAYQVVSRNLSLYPRLVLMDVRQLFYWTSLISYQVLLRVSIALAVIAALDYAFQRHRFMDQLKMTKQEVKEEYKDMEGDPLTRGRIRRIQREMARKRMMSDVPGATVVVTNPTHYAVALRYDMDEMEAPKVVAKGVGFLALKIKELAQKHDIPLVENKPLAQTLYKTVEIGAFIPAGLYKAVAEILAYVYKARNAWRFR
jgi:flagellar biosynthetic protein FlhB